LSSLTLWRKVWCWWQKGESCATKKCQGCSTLEKVLVLVSASVAWN
jgi:hypothetical protein